MFVLYILWRWLARRTAADTRSTGTRSTGIVELQPSINRQHPRLLMLAALCIVAASASAANVNGEAKRIDNNAKRLLEIHAPVRPKFAATLRDLEASGQKPYVVDAYRNHKTQAALKARGVSWVDWSMHNATTPGGKPDSLAVDLVDNRYFWQTGNDFWLMEASAAQGHDLWTGIRWGRTNAERRRIDLLIASKDWRGKYVRGNDPGHCEVTGITYAQAQRGLRPKS